jgi:thiol:disulfide interchange protein DsbD
MKKYLILGLTLLISAVVFGQEATVEPATWSQEFSKSEVEIGDEVEIVFTAPLKPKYHIYSNNYDPKFSPTCGPLLTEFDYSEVVGLKIIGVPKPINVHIYMDDIFDCEVHEFSKKVEFRQKAKVTGPLPSIKGKVDYQICNDRGCLSYNHKFTLAGLKIKKTVKPIEAEEAGTTDKATDKQATSEEIETTTTGEEDIDTVYNGVETEVLKAAEDENGEALEVAADEEEKDIKELSLWALFILGIGGGLIALVTPCVFPMIPMTVAFFTKETDRKKGIRKALFYGASIVSIYVVLGLLLAMVFGETFTYMLSTHWLPNMIFFAIFVFFALSFFGLFELTLPSSFVNKMDAKGDKGGYAGIFFIAFTLVLVSFSCTVPIVGSVSILAAGGEFVKPLVAMLGFAITFALPFVLFAIFPSWLNSLPKSGGWLNSVKVVLGFVELALAFKFLSQADLVYNWGILDRDVFIAIWVVLAMLMGLYLLGKIKFPHDSDMPRIPVLRFLFAVVVFTFGLWMLPGMWGAPLKPLAGLLPPLTTQDYNVQSGGVVTLAESTSDRRFSDQLHLPYGLIGYYTMEEAIVESKKSGKPIFIDFTGKSCANCRKMEENVWPDSEVMKRLKNDFVIASLYCDSRIELPEIEWGKDSDGDVIKTLGEINQQLQLDHFNSYGQPYYYVVDAEMNVLATFAGYENNAPKYAVFLDKGKAAFYDKK